MSAKTGTRRAAAPSEDGRARRPLDEAPQALPAVIWPGILTTLLLLASGVVAAQDALTHTPLLDGDSWFATAVAEVDGWRYAGWMLPTAVICVVAGVLLAWTAVKPRRRTHLRVPGDAEVWISPAAVSALARDAADEVPGVASAAATADTRVVKVTVRGDDPGALSGPVEESVTRRLAPAPVRVRVRARRVSHRGGRAS